MTTADTVTAMTSHAYPAPTMLPIDREDEQTSTALHECAHALAYISVGRDFRHIDMEPDADSNVVAMLVTHPRRIDAWDRAVTAMAGPAAEAFMYYGTTAPATDTAWLILDRLDEARALDEGDEHPEPGHDLLVAGPHAETSLSVVLALLTAHWSSVEAMARLVLAGGQRITTYGELRPLVPERTEVDFEVARAWADALNTAQQPD